MTINIKGISSMATRQVLAELVALYAQQSFDRVGIESVGAWTLPSACRRGAL